MDVGAPVSRGPRSRSATPWPSGGRVSRRRGRGSRQRRWRPPPRSRTHPSGCGRSRRRRHRSCCEATGPTRRALRASRALGDPSRQDHQLAPVAHELAVQDGGSTAAGGTGSCETILQPVTVVGSLFRMAGRAGRSPRAYLCCSIRRADLLRRRRRPRGGGPGLHRIPYRKPTRPSSTLMLCLREWASRRPDPRR